MSYQNNNSGCYKPQPPCNQCGQNNCNCSNLICPILGIAVIGLGLYSCLNRKKPLCKYACYNATSVTATFTGASGTTGATLTLPITSLTSAFDCGCDKEKCTPFSKLLSDGQTIKILQDGKYKIKVKIGTASATIVGGPTFSSGTVGVFLVNGSTSSQVGANETLTIATGGLSGSLTSFSENSYVWLSCGSSVSLQAVFTVVYTIPTTAIALTTTLSNVSVCLEPVSCN